MSIYAHHSLLLVWCAFGSIPTILTEAFSTGWNKSILENKFHTYKFTYHDTTWYKWYDGVIFHCIINFHLNSMPCYLYTSYLMVCLTSYISMLTSRFLQFLDSILRDVWATLQDKYWRSFHFTLGYLSLSLEGNK